MTRTKKFSAVLAVLVAGFLSIYANLPTFTSGNSTQTQLNVTLNMQSGAQIPVSVVPGGNVPTTLNGDQVASITYAGQNDPAGVNAVMTCPSGGTITMMWQMNGGQPVGIVSMPDVETQS